MKHLSLLIIILMCTFSAIAQPWIGPTAGNIYYNQGNVGIGTTSPGNILELGGISPNNFTKGITFSDINGQYPSKILYGSAGSDWGMDFQYPTGASTAVTGLSLRNGKVGIGTTNPINKFVISNGGAGGLEFGAGGNPFGLTNAGYILSYDRSGGTYRDIAFDLGGSIATNVFFKAGGNIGIGTTSPAYKLHVVTTDKSALALQTTNSTVGNPIVDLYDSGRTVETVISSTDGITIGTYIASFTNHPLMFASNHASAQMTLSTSGNVGIGTTSPAYKLHIVTTDKSALALQTTNSTVGNPIVDLYDSGRTAETVISSTDGTTIGTYIASYTNHPLMFASNHAAAQMTLSTSGNVGIGTTTPEAKLTVKGKIVASEIQVKDIGVIADYVFKPDYQLMSLDKVEDFVKQNQHLPEVPSEKEFKKDGMNVAEMNALLLKKVEELTLYSIEQNKYAKEQNMRLDEQAKKIEALEKAMNNLISK